MMMARGKKTGGRQPLSAAGPGEQLATRFPRELAENLREMAADTGEAVSDIVRRGTAAEVAKWKRRRTKG
ncbi:MAG: hypothetical protein ACYC4P_07175 [Thermoanaerobaculia bacterium]